MATITSIATGNWSAGATWVGGIAPVIGDKVIIATGHTVTVDTTGLGGGDDTATGITVQGTLKASRTANSTLRCRGHLWKELAGVIDWGTEVDPIPSTYTALIEINDSAIQANNKWGIVTRQTANATGKISFWGATKTRVTTVSVQAISVNTIIRVVDASGWNVGDILVFDGTSAENSINSHRYRAITAIAGNNVTIGANLGYDSLVGRRVVNLVSNVRISGVNGNIYRAGVSIRIAGAQTTADIVEIGETEFRLSGGGANYYEFGNLSLDFADNTNTMSGIKKIYRPISHTVWSVTGSTVVNTALGGSYALFSLFGGQSSRFTIEEPIGSSVNSQMYIIYAGANVNLLNGTGIRLNLLGSSGYSQGSVGSTVNGGYYSCLYRIIYGTGITIAINNATFDCIQSISNQVAFGSYIVNRCSFVPVIGWIGNSIINYPNGALVPLLLDTCTFGTNTPILRGVTNLNNVTNDLYVNLRNQNNDITQNIIYKRGGYVERNNSIFYRSTSSLALHSWYSTADIVHSQPVQVQANQTIRVLGYCRYNALYGTTYPTTLTISGGGATPATFTCPTSGADTWFPIDLSITNPQSYPVTFAMDFKGRSNANAINAIVYFDGMIITDFIIANRHYGFKFTNTSAQTVDPYITQTIEATVGTYTGISINHGTNTITLTSNHSIQEIYDYCKYNLVQTANLGGDDFFTTTDGISFVSTYNLTLNGGSITGTGNINLGSMTFTRTGSETSTMPITSASGASVFGNVTVSGLVANSRVRLNNNTDNIELYNAVVAGTSVSIPAIWTADKVLDLRITNVIGLTAYLPFQATGTLTSTLASFTVSQVNDGVYATNAIDGSTVTEYTADYPNIQIDINDADGGTTVARLYAWFQYSTHSSQGIVFYFNGIIAGDEFNYEIQTAIVDLLLDNVSGTSLPIKISGAYLYRDDGTTVIFSGSKSVQLDPGKAYTATVGDLANSVWKTDLAPYTIVGTAGSLMKKASKPKISL